MALFSRRPLEEVRDGRRRHELADVERAAAHPLFERFGIDPEFVPMAPDLAAMLERCDAALIIGDPALFLDVEAAGVEKIDLGEEWTAMTGLPFVWAFWAGRAGALTPDGWRRR